jgi:hypothetical protein
MSTYTATYNEKDEDGNAVGSQTLTAEYNFGSSLSEATEMFGEDIVLAHFAAHAVVSLQSRMRSAAKQGLDVQDSVDTWKPGQVTRRGKSPVEKALGAFEKMDEAQQQAFIEQLKEAAS